MTARMLRKPLPVNTTGGRIAGTNPVKAAHDDSDDPTRVARVDQAHKSDRGHRGGNLGKRK